MSENSQLSKSSIIAPEVITMENLLQNLQRTIRALESLSERPLTETEQVEALLDQLFQQKIDLVNRQFNAGSPLFQQAAHAVSLAATQTEKAVRTPAALSDALTQVEDAAGKLGNLLNGSLP
jgi:hypothetical protein